MIRIEFWNQPIQLSLNLKLLSYIQKNEWATMLSYNIAFGLEDLTNVAFQNTLSVANQSASRNETSFFQPQSCQPSSQIREVVEVCNIKTPASTNIWPISLGISNNILLPKAKQLSILLCSVISYLYTKCIPMVCLLHWTGHNRTEQTPLFHIW